MKKSNEKGFVLAETIAISALVITVLVILFVQFISINNSYNTFFKYNNVNDIYAVDNIKKYIETDGINNLSLALNGEKYIDFTDCSQAYFQEYNYCQTLLENLDVKKAIFTYEDISNLVSTNLSEGMKNYIKTISFNKNNRYRIIVEFNSGRYANLKVGSFIVSNISNDCALRANRCSNEDIINGVSLDFSVNDNKTYNFNVINDDGTTLTLLMNSTLGKTPWGSISAPNIEFLATLTSDWNNVIDIVYNLKGNNQYNYNFCTTYNNCSKNNYNVSKINTKARLPRIQELTSLGCTDDYNTCPSWMNNTASFWTSNVDNNNVWIYNGKLSTISSNDYNTSIRPVIMVDKNIIK